MQVCLRNKLAFHQNVVDIPLSSPIFDVNYSFKLAAFFTEFR
jgi:hypothetical protein